MTCQSRMRAAAGLLLGTALGTAMVPAHAGEFFQLNDGEGIIFELPAVEPGQALIPPDFFIEVPAEATQLRVELEGVGEGMQVDLYLRPDSPFDLDNVSNTGDLLAQAAYYSLGVAGVEQVTVQDSTFPPVHGRTWYLLVVALEGPLGDATLVADFSSDPPQPAQITVDFTDPLEFPNCDLAPWDDPTPFTPVGGNPATTVGEARRNAVMQAATNLSSELFSPVPIRINACWEDQGGDSSGQTLAGAFFSLVSRGVPGVEDPELIYATPAAARQAGTEFCRIFNSVECDSPELFIVFNSAVDSEDSTRDFYYGFDGFESNLDVNFISVATHEITHGLGFGTLADEMGALGTEDFPFGDAFINQMGRVDAGQVTPLADPAVTDADRADAFVSENELKFLGAEASLDPENSDFLSASSYVGLYAPETYDPGSSVSHLNNTFCDLMRFDTLQCGPSALQTLGVARPMMHAVGWAPARNAPNYVGLLLDRTRVGHGFDLQLGGADGDGNDVYVMTFYTFEDSGGAPEWFQAIGIFRHGVFEAIRNPDGFGFPRYLYQSGRTPPQQADPDTRAQTVISYNDVLGKPACNDGTDRTGASALASFEWLIGNTRRAWCVEPLTLASTRPAVDFGGLWFAGNEDTGWGFTIENIENPDGSIDIFVLLYVYAADGTPVWYFAFESGFEPGQPLAMTLQQRSGYRRPLTGTLDDVSDTPAGTLVLTLVEPSNSLAAGNRVSVDVTYQGPEGGSWIRDDVPIQRLSLDR
ncbi:MAG: hypothetical protein QNJ40_13365 [Xanthomonadales bacterium]|nr:hypothetical protein [Xanthomonadales bacterium]